MNNIDTDDYTFDLNYDMNILRGVGAKYAEFVQDFDTVMAERLRGAEILMDEELKNEINSFYTRHRALRDAIREGVNFEDEELNHFFGHAENQPYPLLDHGRSRSLLIEGFPAAKDPVYMRSRGFNIDNFVVGNTLAPDEYKYAIDNIKGRFKALTSTELPKRNTLADEVRLMGKTLGYNFDNTRDNVLMNEAVRRKDRIITLDKGHPVIFLPELVPRPTTQKEARELEYLEGTPFESALPLHIHALRNRTVDETNRAYESDDIKNKIKWAAAENAHVALRTWEEVKNPNERYPTLHNAFNLLLNTRLMNVLDHKGNPRISTANRLMQRGITKNAMEMTPGMRERFGSQIEEIVRPHAAAQYLYNRLDHALNSGIDRALVSADFTGLGPGDEDIIYDGVNLVTTEGEPLKRPKIVNPGALMERRIKGSLTLSEAHDILNALEDFKAGRVTDQFKKVANDFGFSDNFTYDALYDGSILNNVFRTGPTMLPFPEMPRDVMDLSKPNPYFVTRDIFNDLSPSPSPEQPVPVITSASTSPSASPRPPAVQGTAAVQGPVGPVVVAPKDPLPTPATVPTKPQLPSVRPAPPSSRSTAQRFTAFPTLDAKRAASVSFAKQAAALPDKERVFLTHAMGREAVRSLSRGAPGRRTGVMQTAMRDANPMETAQDRVHKRALSAGLGTLNRRLAAINATIPESLATELYRAGFEGKEFNFNNHPDLTEDEKVFIKATLKDIGELTKNSKKIAYKHSYAALIADDESAPSASPTPEQQAAPETPAAPAPAEVPAEAPAAKEATPPPGPPTTASAAPSPPPAQSKRPSLPPEVALPAPDDLVDIGPAPTKQVSPPVNILNAAIQPAPQEVPMTPAEQQEAVAQAAGAAAAMATQTAPEDVQAHATRAQDLLQAVDNQFGPTWNQAQSIVQNARARLDHLQNSYENLAANNALPQEHAAQARARLDALSASVAQRQAVLNDVSASILGFRNGLKRISKGEVIESPSELERQISDAFGKLLGVINTEEATNAEIIPLLRDAQERQYNLQMQRLKNEQDLKRMEREQTLAELRAQQEALRREQATILQAKINADAAAAAAANAAAAAARADAHQFNMAAQTAANAIHAEVLKHANQEAARVSEHARAAQMKGADFTADMQMKAADFDAQRQRNAMDFEANRQNTADTRAHEVRMKNGDHAAAVDMAKVNAEIAKEVRDDQRTAQREQLAFQKKQAELDRKARAAADKLEKEREAARLSHEISLLEKQHELEATKQLATDIYNESYLKHLSNLYKNHMNFLAAMGNSPSPEVQVKVLDMMNILMNKLADIDRAAFVTVDSEKMTSLIDPEAVNKLIETLSTDNSNRRSAMDTAAANAARAELARVEHKADLAHQAAATAVALRAQTVGPGPTGTVIRGGSPSPRPMGGSPSPKPPTQVRVRAAKTTIKRKKGALAQATGPAAKRGRNSKNSKKGSHEKK